MKTINNWPSLVSKFQGFSFTNDDNDCVDKTTLSTTSDNHWYRQMNGHGLQEVFTCSRQLAPLIPQVSAFTSFSSSISFLAKDYVWIVLYDVSILDVKKELIISSNSSK